MKKIFYFFSVAALALGVAACQKIESEDTFTTEPVAPELYAHSDILLTTGTTGEEVVFSWSAYRNLPEGLSYDFYMERGGTSVSLANTKDTWYKTGKDAFRTLLLGSFSDIPENDTFSVNMYVRVADGGEVYESNTIAVNIYAYGDGVAPVVTLASEAVELDPSDPLGEIELITWEPARLVYGETVSYNVYLKVAEAAPALSAVGRKAVDAGAYLLAEGIAGTSYSTTVDALNEAVVAAGGEEAADVDVTFIVEAVCESLPGGVEAASAKMTVTTYLATFPEVLYTPGSHQGWDPASSATLAQSSSVKGYYEGIIDLTTEDGNDAEFKFSPYPEWKDDFGGKVEVGGKDGVYVSANGTIGVSDNIKVPSGVYVVMLNKKLNTIQMVSLSSVGIIGTAVGGWDAEIPMEWNKETNVFTVTTNFVADEYKFRLNDDWDYSIDDTYGVNGGGANLKASSEGNYKVTLDMSRHPYAVKFINTSYPESVGVTGNHQGWDPASAPRLNGDGEGHYEGFVAMDGEFKFTPNLDWSAEYAGSMDNLVSSGGGNLSLDKGYYKLTLDLSEMKAGATLITDVEVVGSFTDWGTSEDYLMSYDAGSDSWKLTGATIPAGGQWKFRMNRDWEINVGGAVDNLVQDGGNITDTEPGVYTIELFLATTPYHAVLTKTAELDGPAYSTKLVVAGNYYGHRWSATEDPALLGSGDGKFQGPLTMYGTGIEFKFVHNGSWIGNTSADGLNWTLGDGENLTLASAGTYFWKVDLVANTATAMEITKVGLIGDFNDWADDVEMSFDATTLTYSGKITTTAADQGFKVRFNGNWDYSMGGDINELTSLNGANISIAAAGEHTIVLDMASATPKLTIE